ncbi:hypothetical protein HMPREF3226_02507 [Prevotella corporis]|uniref:Uncharacterized protein n=1 Tax=Prevotella corporis TaxID=28128 RepID=A0A133PVP1_9BACT|nr:hypothetical protein HMPREF3226_02507 [Prevotella corporis]
MKFTCLCVAMRIANSTGDVTKVRKKIQQTHSFACDIRNRW